MVPHLETGSFRAPEDRENISKPNLNGNGSGVKTGRVSIGLQRVIGSGLACWIMVEEVTDAGTLRVGRVRKTQKRERNTYREKREEGDEEVVVHGAVNGSGGRESKGRAQSSGRA